MNDIREGMSTVFPMGLVHYQQNLDCKPARYISALNSEDPGVLTVSTRLFDLPEEALAVAFNLVRSNIRSLKQNLPNSIARGQRECLARCNKK